MIATILFVGVCLAGAMTLASSVRVFWKCYIGVCGDLDCRPAVWVCVTCILALLCIIASGGGTC